MLHCQRQLQCDHPVLICCETNVAGQAIILRNISAFGTILCALQATMPYVSLIRWPLSWRAVHICSPSAIYSLQCLSLARNMRLPDTNFTQYEVPQVNRFSHRLPISFGGFNGSR